MAMRASAQVKAERDPGDSRQGPQLRDEGPPTAGMWGPDRGRWAVARGSGAQGHSGRKGSGLRPSSQISEAPCWHPVAAIASHHISQRIHCHTLESRGASLG